MVRPSVSHLTPNDPLDKRALIWTGMLTKSQRTVLQPYLLPLPLLHSWALLTDASRSFARATRALLETYRLLLVEASPNMVHPAPHLPFMRHYDITSLEERSSPSDRQANPFLILSPVSGQDSATFLRLREEGDYG